MATFPTGRGEEEGSLIREVQLVEKDQFWKKFMTSTLETKVIILFRKTELWLQSSLRR